MKQLLEAIRAKYLCLHDWEVVSKTEYTDCWKILLKCKKCGKLRKKREKREYERSIYSYN